MSSVLGSTTDKLSAFNSVQVCTPFSVLVSSSEDSSYGISVDADSDVRRAIKASVSNQQLSLETSGNFRTSNPIKVTVLMPKGALESISANSPFTSSVKVQSGVAADGLAVTAGGAGSVTLTDLDNSRLSISKTGAGTVVASGRADSVSVNGQGVGTVYLKGAIKDAEFTLSGVTKAAIDSSDGGLQIRGDLSQLSKVTYTQGACNIQSDSPFGSGFPFGGLNMDSMFAGCDQVQSIDVPSLAEWTAGIDVSGSFTCNGEHGGSSSASAGTPGTPGSSSVGGFAASGTPGTPGTSSVSGTNGANGADVIGNVGANGADGVSYSAVGGQGGRGGSAYSSSNGNTVVRGADGQDGSSITTGGDGQSFQGNDGGVRTIRSNASQADLQMS